MRHALSFLSAAALITGLTALPAGGAQAQTYTFEVPAKLTGISFESRMEIEDIIGTSNVIRGSLKMQGTDKVSFQLAVPVTSLRTGIEMRDEHLRGEMWLDAKRSPRITFRGETVKKLDGKRYQVAGRFGMRGVERPLTVEVRAHRIEAERAAKLGLPRANWVRLRGEFKVKLSDHGVKIPKMAAAKVSDVWTVKVSLFAQEVS